MILLILVLLLPLFISYYFKKKKRYEEVWKYLDDIPGPKSYPILGTNYKMHTRESLFIRDRIRAIELYPIYKLWSFNIPAVVVMHPEDIELVVNNSKHNKKSLIYSFLHDWLGTGLLTSEGTKWNKRRKILTPAFHFNILQEFVGMLNKETQILVDNLMKLSDAPHIDVTKPITEFTLYSIGETSLGVSLREDPNCKRYKQAVYDFGEYFAYRCVRPWLFFSLIYKLSSVYKKTRKTINILHDFSQNVINERKKTFVPNDNLSYSDRKRLALLDLMLKAKHDGADIDDEGIREELDTFIFEGHDTTSVSICFTLMVLANEPKIQEEIYQELLTVVGESEEPSYQELGDLKYLERCIKESLRLYPSVPIIARIAGENIETKTGYTIPKDCNVSIYIYDMHRRPEFWENPEKFDPDRFLLENAIKRHPFAYIPFSAGSRNCIGQRFALLEIKAVLCGILRKFKLEPVTRPENIVYAADLVLRPSGEINVKFVPRV
ncbi:unnamed protein product [Diabrotica balteata]|uniref:Cytochrome P450 n=1 Tax=Diabrotica balteata TaxID=107213 RepID=A0A9N9XAX7_DIABA|nr:unnamed protein product [Diabrotica balteata]